MTTFEVPVRNERTGEELVLTIEESNQYDAPPDAALKAWRELGWPSVTAWPGRAQPERRE